VTKIYRDYDADELTAQINAGAGVTNIDEIQQQNGADTARTRKAIPCEIDVAYGAEPLQKLDIYYPKDKKAGGYPIVIDIHGGGWRGGSKNGRGWPAETLIPKGCVWTTIDYGLAPAYRIDQIVDHVRSAVAWVYKTVAKYGGDPNRITVCGHSAGGHLTGTLLMEGWHAKYGVPENVFKGACLSSGVYDMEALVGASAGYNDELGMTKEVARAHSPYYHLPKKSCPAIIAYGGKETDEFMRQSRDFAKAWAAAGLKVETFECANDHHFSIARTQINPNSAFGKAFVKMIGL
jgi:arylformamidase